MCVCIYIYIYIYIYIHTHKFKIIMCVYIYIYIYIYIHTHTRLFCTIFDSILQYNISLHHNIYCDSGLPYYTCLFMLTNHNFILFSLKCNDDVLFFSYNHLHKFCTQVHIEINKDFFFLSVCYNCILRGKQPQVYCAAYLSSHTPTLNTTYTSTHNNTLLWPTQTQAHKDLYTIPFFYSVFRFFFNLFIFFSLSAWWSLFVKIHETKGRRQTSMALNI